MSTSPPAHILVVDDDRATLLFLEAALSGPDRTVEAVQDAESAVAAFRRRRPDVVLTDIGLPGMDGLGLLRAVRALDLDVPVVLATGRPALQSAIEAVELGALSYLVKPVPIRDLREAIDRAVQLSRLARVRRELLEVSGRTEGQVGDRVGLEGAFAEAIDLLWLAYQPIVRWSTRGMFAYEALVRSRSTRLPHPGALLDAAERLDRLPDLGRAIRGRAVLPPDALLFLNLHPLDLTDEQLFDANAPVSRLADRVVLELTERSSLDHVPDVRNRIDRLRELGFRVAIDDLGAGYAGLSAFAALTPDVCKLDMSLVRGVDADPVRQRLMGSMIGLCRDLKIELVAEGVETVAERDTLIELGCDLFQGYLFARPGPPFPEVTW
jgi:EAL domain-containing protein (putative c-di-GMP-specific phosphodiesterase class I)